MDDRFGQPAPGFAPPQDAHGAAPHPSVYYLAQANPYMYGYNAAPQPQRPYSAVRGLAIAITCVLGIQFASLALGFFAFGERLSLLKKLDRDPGSVAQHTIDASDRAVGIASGLDGLTFVAVAVLLVIWLWQARTNAGIYSPDVMGLHRGWAIGGWFIPLAWWVLPYLVARDTHIGTTRGLRDRRQSGSVVTWVWWLFWIASSVLALVADVQATHGDKSDQLVYLRDLRESTPTEVVLCPVFLVTGVLLLVWIWKVTRLQRMRNAEIAAAAPAAGYGFGMPGPVPGSAYGYQGPGYQGYQGYQGAPGLMPQQGMVPGAGMPPMPPMPPALGTPGAPGGGGWPQSPPAMPAYPPVSAYPPAPPAMPPAPPNPLNPLNPPTLVDRVPEGWPTAVENPPTIVDRIPELHTTAVPAVQDAVPTRTAPAVQDAVPTQAVPMAQDAVPTQTAPAVQDAVTREVPRPPAPSDQPEPPAFAAPQ